ncbi:YgfZ family protein [Candidatus Sneabacter namystus]|uniref:CAF17 C-terminal domain-containing protein n=1 Tax=Candidatus Sneabacter namystus TaxID=2601646 RepID=A0A5C0UI70_9RICK|nr:hypothetical protein [Candidatus Sneabacter namystus]QEK39467.1 hypothetical protein FZC37_00740 [Candidatus Sneabacter namystus]
MTINGNDKSLQIQNIYSVIHNRYVIICQGEKISYFLSGLLTNDASKSCYTLLLSASGRYISDVFLHVIDDKTTIIDASNSKVLDLLSFYKLRNNITLEDISNKCKVIFSNNKLAIPGTICSMSDPRISNFGIRTIITENNCLDDSTSPNLYLSQKYSFCIPDGETDMVSSKSVPMEFGINHLHGINLSKGCYLGQEAIMRTFTQGVIRKHLYQMCSVNKSIALDNIDNGSKILNDKNEPVGTWCSGWQNLGIALLRSEKIQRKTQLTVNNIQVTEKIAPWYPRKILT